MIRKNINLIIIFSFFFQIAQSQIVPVTASLGGLQRDMEEFYGYNSGSTIRYVSWDTPQFPDALKTLHAEIYRFPAGAYSNWWDWRTGWVKKADQMPPKVVLPGKYMLNYQYDNTLEKFKQSLDATGATPIFLLNMVSSTLDDQIALLYHAKCIGLPIKYVELGKEFYDDDPSVLAVFPTAESFAETMYTWTREIVKHFPNARVGFNASFEYDRFPSPHHRRISWNKKIIDVLNAKGNFPYANSAPSMYIFYGSGNGNTGLPISTYNQVNNMMNQGFLILDHIQQVEVPRFNQFPEIWISEINLMDTGTGVHGTWGHGMFTVLVAMRLLEEPKISKGLIHNIVGDAVYSSLFESNDALCLGGEGGFQSPIPLGSTCANYPTTYLGKSAQGNTLGLMGHAMMNCNKARKLTFTGAPFIGNSSNRSVYGFKFWNSNAINSDQYIVLNMANNTCEVDLASLALGNVNKFDQITQSPFTPVQDNLPVTSGNIVSNKVTLPPYSITRLRADNTSALKAWTIEDTICNGQSTSLHARGASTYTWAPAAGLSATNGSDIVAAPTANTTYTVTDNFGSAKTISIVVGANPTIHVTGVPKGKMCQGSLPTITASGGTYYHWSPKPEQILNASQNRARLRVSNSTTYTVYATNGTCWCGEKPFTLNVKGEYKLGTDRLNCSGEQDSLTSGTKPHFFNFQWTASNSTFTSTLFKPIVAPTDTTAYYMRVQNGFCIYRDTIVINTMNCCTGTITLKNPTTASLYAAVQAQCGSCVTKNQGVFVIRNYTGKVVINGKLYVDESLKILNCPNITLNDGGQIELNQAADFTVDSNTTLADCNGKMWKGIYSYDANNIVTVYKGKIKNALIGVDATIDTKLDIEDAVFENNGISIYMHDFLKNSTGSIVGSTFTCDSATMLPPYTNRRTDVHLKINGIAKANIGSAAGGQNIFRNAYNGVTIEHCEVGVYNSLFENIIATNSTNGIALKVTGFNQRFDPALLGNTGNSKLVFNNCSRAIEGADYLVLRVRNNTFTNCGKSIYASKCSDSLYTNPLEISGNTFTNTGSAMELYLNSNSTIDIINNTISTSGDSAFGISIQDIKALSTSILDIEDNTITNCKQGIFMNQAARKGTIRNNTIVVAKPVGQSKTFCIKNYNTDSLTISQNNFYYDTTQAINTNTRGLFNQNVKLNTFSDNLIRGFENGILFTGTSCNPNSLRCNKFFACSKGLVLESQAVIGAQGDSAGAKTWQNRWEPAGFCDSANAQGNFSVYMNNAPGAQSTFFTLATYPYKILTSGIQGAGSKINGKVITGTGVNCILMLNNDNDQASIRNEIPASVVNINDSDLDALWQLASQCPDDAGNAVFEARTLLSNHYQTIIDFENACDKTNAISLITEFTVYPNPASDHIILSLDGLIDEEITVRILDAYGKVVYATIMKNVSSLPISTQQLSNGVYRAILVLPDQRALQRTFTVLK
ncbi:MAG: T9SS type A sorting domain-containing protein [Bacteroidetes bacterium]|nr:T9SS type A sorting domain-containing protein [Bacteroidota bacterium]